MRLGVNFPWVTCGHDFGPRPPAWAGAAPTDWARVEVELTSLAAIGITSVRWWLLGGGVNFPCGIEPSAIASRRPFGSTFPADAHLWEPVSPLPPLPAAFIEDFERLLVICERAGLALWPSLCSFESFLPIEEQAGGVTSRGRGQLLLDSGFYDSTLEPLLDACERHRGGLFAFEVINEPSWALTAGWLHARFGDHPPWVSAEAMSAFVLDGVDRIARRGITATIGFLDASVPWLDVVARARLRSLAARGLYVHQHHHYPGVTGQRALPPAWRSAVQPVWIGEVSTTRHGRWRGSGLAEDDDEAFLRRRLEHIEARGYAGALLWARHASDPHAGWDERVEAAVRAAR